MVPRMPKNSKIAQLTTVDVFRAARRYIYEKITAPFTVRPLIRTERLYAIRKQYEAYLEEDKKRKERNEFILGKLDKMCSCTTVQQGTKSNPLENAQYVPLQKIPQCKIPLPQHNTPVQQFNIPLPRPRPERSLKYITSQLHPHHPIDYLRCESSILNEIANKYILIPKSNIYHSLPHGTLDENDSHIVTSNVPEKDENTDWKTKYEILNKLKRDEKEPPEDTLNLVNQDRFPSLNNDYIRHDNENVLVNERVQSILDSIQTKPEAAIPEKDEPYSCKEEYRTELYSNLKLENQTPQDNPNENQNTEINERPDTRNNNARDSKPAYFNRIAKQIVHITENQSNKKDFMDVKLVPEYNTNNDFGGKIYHLNQVPRETTKQEHLNNGSILKPKIDTKPSLESDLTKSNDNSNDTTFEYNPNSEVNQPMNDTDLDSATNVYKPTTQASEFTIYHPNSAYEEPRIESENTYDINRSDPDITFDDSGNTLNAGNASNEVEVQRRMVGGTGEEVEYETTEFKYSDEKATIHMVNPDTYNKNVPNIENSATMAHDIIHATEAVANDHINVDGGAYAYAHDPSAQGDYLNYPAGQDAYRYNTDPNMYNAIPTDMYEQVTPAVNEVYGNTGIDENGYSASHQNYAYDGSSTVNEGYENTSAADEHLNDNTAPETYDDVSNVYPVENPNKNPDTASQLEHQEDFGKGVYNSGVKEETYEQVVGQEDQQAAGDGYNQENPYYYEGQEQTGPLEINEHEETQQNYDPYYEQQYKSTYDENFQGEQYQQQGYEQGYEQQGQGYEQEAQGEYQQDDHQQVYEQLQYEQDNEPIQQKVEEQLAKEEGIVQEEVQVAQK